LIGSETGLIALYDFEDGTGSSILTDLAGGDQNGTLTNMDPASDWITGAICIPCVVDQTVAAAQSTFTCEGSTTIDLGSSEIGVDYYLRDNANDTIIDGPIAGTGSGISLNTGYISSTMTYNVNAESVGVGAMDTVDTVVLDNSFENIPFDKGDFGTLSGDWTGPGWWTQFGAWGLDVAPPDGNRAIAANTVGDYQTLAETYVAGQTYLLSAYTYSRSSGAGEFDLFLTRGDLTLDVANPSTYVATNHHASSTSFIKRELSYTATSADDGQQIVIAEFPLRAALCGIETLSLAPSKSNDVVVDVLLISAFTL